MKRIIMMTIMIITAVFVLAGCVDSDGASASGDNTVVISERFFVNEMLEIVMNHRQYLGRTLQFEGMFRAIPVDDVDRFIVMRYMDGCCGQDAIGLEVIIGDLAPFAHDAWVEVTGTLDLDDGFLVVRVTSITELEERGSEFVS